MDGEIVEQQPVIPNPLNKMLPNIERTSNLVGKSNYSSQSASDMIIDEFLVYDYYMDNSQLQCLFDKCLHPC